MSPGAAAAVPGAGVGRIVWPLDMVCTSLRCNRSLDHLCFRYGRRGLAYGGSLICMHPSAWHNTSSAHRRLGTYPRLENPPGFQGKAISERQRQ
eukprot:9208933-Pyramimonas_sp.AAC.2